MESVWFIFLVIVLFLLIIQINFKLRFMFNVLKNQGIIKFSIFNFSIIRFSFSIEKGMIKIVNKKHKVTFLPLDFQNETFQEYADFNLILFKKIHLNKIILFVNFGVSDDAFVTSIMCGGLVVCVGMLSSIVNSKKGYINFSDHIYPSYNKNRLNFSFRANVSLSLLDYFWCVMENIIKKRGKALNG